MRIATWNVNGLRARLEFVLHWLRDRRPDVVGLQEIKVEESQFPYSEFAALGFHAVVLGQKSWNGVAILSRTPAEPVALGLPDQEEFGARLIAADVAGIRVASVYCPNGKAVDHPDYPRKLAWFDAFAKHLETLRCDRPTVIGGDFNVCPAPIDSWNEAALGGHIFHTDAERSRFQKIIDTGLRDAFRLKHPDTQAFSWWDYRGGAFHKKQGLRIDFLLVNEAAAARIHAVEIDRDYRKKKDALTASDHAPVIVDLDL